MFTLAMLECWRASFLIGGQDYGNAAHCLIRAIGYLEGRARARDPREPWRPVLGAGWVGERPRA